MEAGSNLGLQELFVKVPGLFSNNSKFFIWYVALQRDAMVKGHLIKALRSALLWYQILVDFNSSFLSGLLDHDPPELPSCLFNSPLMSWIWWVKDLIVWVSLLQMTIRNFWKNKAEGRTWEAGLVSPDPHELVQTCHSVSPTSLDGGWLLQGSSLVKTTNKSWSMCTRISCSSSAWSSASVKAGDLCTGYIYQILPGFFKNSLQCRTSICVCVLWSSCSLRLNRQMAHGLQMAEIAQYKKRKAEKQQQEQLAKKKNWGSVMHYKTMYNITDLVGASCPLPKKVWWGWGATDSGVPVCSFKHNSRGRSRSNTGVSVRKGKLLLWQNSVLLLYKFIFSNMLHQLLSLPIQKFKNTALSSVPQTDMLQASHTSCHGCLCLMVFHWTVYGFFYFGFTGFSKCLWPFYVMCPDVCCFCWLFMGIPRPVGKGL